MTGFTMNRAKTIKKTIPEKLQQLQRSRKKYLQTKFEKVL